MPLRPMLTYALGSRENLAIVRNSRGTSGDGLIHGLRDFAAAHAIRSLSRELPGAEPANCPPQSGAANSQAARRLGTVPAVRFQDREYPTVPDGQQRLRCRKL